MRRPFLDVNRFLGINQSLFNGWGAQVWKSDLEGRSVTHKRKTSRAAPHDLRVPEGDPFISVNVQGIQDTNGWKDLPSKFALIVYRDYIFAGRTDKAFLKETWPSVKMAVEYPYSSTAEAAYLTTAAIQTRFAMIGS